MKYFKAFLFFILTLAACTPLKQARESFDTGNYRQTITICNQALTKDSTNTAAMKLIADSYFKLEQYDSSYTFYKTLLLYSPNEKSSKEKISRIHIIKGDLLFDENEYFKAISQYKESLSMVPEQTLVIKKIGNSYLSAGRHDNAREWFEKIQFSSDSADVAVKLLSINEYQDKALAHYQTGLNFKKEKKYYNALKEFEKALELKPDYNEAKYQKYMVSAIPIYRKGNKNKLWDAIEAFGLASALFPEKAEPHYYMGMAYNKKDKDEYENAISELLLAIEAEPQSEYAQRAKTKITELKKRKQKMQEFLSH